ncbi:thioesterase [Billgrantia tianxiuensis]|jgi:thioesterase domain-containing protein|uniref:Thioesterase n=1 Tax=Billgrantia tianxiuensis TaxID=2497861 RepID=A0A6I6SQ19_9GAMM|nr:MULTISPECIES: YiiD C-terminal domain-containing protein [Halomonas]MCE8032462.1 thioesterase [Halomonas sp. MCCC 1A11057]QHC49575.1 thioesterase [Halomonas tianxiuensis]
MREVGVPHPRLPLPEPGQRDEPQAFHTWLAEAIPMVEHLGIREMRWEGESLVWELALEPNLNDKGTGFGGALTAQTTLLGWCWVTLWLRERGYARDVVVAEASQRFLAPVTGDYRLTCSAQSEQGPATLVERLASRGRGRISLVQQLWCGDTPCLEAHGDYAVLPAG